jgi:prepilin-type N-terminal cleavage/methylation domain-containing protein
MRCFTLIEVIVALAILGLSLVALLSLSNHSQQRLMKARDRWNHMHMIAQGAEYYLLQPTEDPPYISTDFFDYPGYVLNFKYQDAEGLPDQLNQLANQEPLRCLVLELFRSSDNQVVEHLTIDRINYGESQ